MATVEEYLALIPHQHKDKPKFNEELKIYLEPQVSVQNFLDSLDYHFDLDEAKGKQLDIVAEKVGGVSRLLPFQPKNNLNPMLKDEDFRFLIKAQILRTIWKGKTEDIYALWDNLYKHIHICIKDNQDMTMDALVIGQISDLQRQMVENGLIVPKPHGVRLNFGFAIPPIYSYDQDEDYFKGHDESHWLEFNI